MSQQRVSLADYLEQVTQLMRQVDERQLQRLRQSLTHAYDNERFVFVCGNGGSGSNASHICEDFGKSTLNRLDFEDDSVKRLRILSLTDNTAYILAWANDEGFERVFVEQLKNLASPGDVLISLSGSGNSANVLRAVDWANRHELVTWGITGFDGGVLKEQAQHSLHVPSCDMGTVESLHLLLFHWVLGEVYAHIHPERAPLTPDPEALLAY